MLASAVGEALPLRMLDTAERLTVPKVLDRFEDAGLVWSDCFILGDLFQNSYYATGEYHARNLATRDRESLAGRTAGIAILDDGLAISEQALADAQYIPGRTMFATPHEPHHWGLFLVSSLPALEWFRNSGVSYDNLFVHLNHPNMRALFNRLDIDPGRVVEHDPLHPYLFESVDLQRTPRMDFHIAPSERALFRTLATGVGDIPPASRIFVSRRSRSRDDHRLLRNEAELIAVFAPLGFTIVEPEQLSAEDQMALFATADVVAGLGGGGMFNAVFCRPGTRLLSFESDPRFVDRHANLFASLSLDYGMILGTPAADGSWSIDVRAVLPHIRRFLRA